MISSFLEGNGAYVHNTCARLIRVEAGNKAFSSNVVDVCQCIGSKNKDERLNENCSTCLTVHLLCK